MPKCITPWYCDKMLNDPGLSLYDSSSLGSGGRFNKVDSRTRVWDNRWEFIKALPLTPVAPLAGSHLFLSQHVMGSFKWCF